MLARLSEELATHTEFKQSSNHGVGDTCTMGCDGSSTSDEEAVPHNIWNSLLSAVVHSRIEEAMQPLQTEEAMGKVALVRE